MNCVARLARFQRDVAARARLDRRGTDGWRLPASRCRRRAGRRRRTATRSASTCASTRHSSLPCEVVRDDGAVAGRDDLGAQRVLPDERRHPRRLHAESRCPIAASATAPRRSSRRAPRSTAAPRCPAAGRRGRRRRSATRRCRSRGRSAFGVPLLLPQQRAVERIDEQADVLSERGVEPLAVGERRFRRVGVLAMAAAERLRLDRFALPLHLAGLARRARRPCSGSRRPPRSARCRAPASACVISSSDSPCAAISAMYSLP